MKGSGKKKKNLNLKLVLASLPASYFLVESVNDVIFFFGEATMLNIRSKVIEPSQATTFSTSFEA